LSSYVCVVILKCNKIDICSFIKLKRRKGKEKG
jgi:hypothetical protein